MNEELTRLLSALDATGTVKMTDDAQQMAHLIGASRDELSRLLNGILQLARRDAVVDQLLSPVLRAVVQSRTWNESASPTIDPGIIAEIYTRLGSSSASRHLLLTGLVTSGDRESFQTFAELMATDPPARTQDVVEACVPLWRQAQAPFDALFPRLMDAIQHPSAATIVLDLANYLAVNGRLLPHPASGRRADLLDLFSRLIERLEGFADLSRQQGVTDLRAAQQVAESVGLAVALCFALSLLKERRAIGRFHRMLDLRHRRLRVEAAAGLARLKEQAGRDALIELASEPSVRLSVLAYASEIGILDEIPAQHRSSIARAEAELVAKISEPSFFGFPPSDIELVDSRSMHWPGFDEPIDCHLFRFTYPLPSGDLSNIGLAGPVAHAFAADMTRFEVDDLYAAFAGWEAEHDEIRQYEIDPTNAHQTREVDQFRRKVEQAGFEPIEVEFIGEFFGQRCLVVACQRNNEPGYVVASASEVDWFPSGDALRPLNADLAYAIYKGRKLLRTFNP